MDTITSGQGASSALSIRAAGMRNRTRLGNYFLIVRACFYRFGVFSDSKSHRRRPSASSRLQGKYPQRPSGPAPGRSRPAGRIGRATAEVRRDRAGP
jgi:hypothetical protein